jgi:hypothetical protein
MNYTRDTAFGAAALVILLVLYVRGVPQAVYAAVTHGGSDPSTGATGAGNPRDPGASAQGTGNAPGGSQGAPGGNPWQGIIGLHGSPPGVAPGLYTTPVLDDTLGNGATDAYNQYHGVPTANGGDTWFDLIFPCIMRTGSVSACIPKG